MKISTQAIKFINEHYHSAGDPAVDGVTDLVERIGAQLGAVEEIVNFGDRFDGIVVAKVVSCVDHPNSDHLHICKIDDGKAVADVDRDDQGYVQVVCGAPNVREGLTVAWLPPGSTVPESIDKEPFILEARPLRGEMSNGMLASARELTLGDNHEGILELDDDVTAGSSFAEAYHLKNDVIIDMENKMFTHRPDCFGYLGIAREIEGIYHRPYKSPEWYGMHPEVPGVETDELLLTVKNELPELVPRFVAIVLSNVEIKASPVWLQADLARAGVRSINNIVDYTNFFMLETGQPLHAYDYDKVKALSGGEGAMLVIRHPEHGEKILLLNGKEIEPRSEAIMIATDTQLIGVAGAMGGGDTEVDEHTKNIILECASFNMYSIRRTSMTHGIFTDAVTRFTKGQSPLQNLAVINKVISDIRNDANGKVASKLIDDNHLPLEVIERGNVYAPVTVSREFVNARLGFQLSAEEMKQLLENVEFRVDIDGETLTIHAPFWRMDIEIPEDVVEEVGRLYGFDHLPLELPKRSLLPAAKEPFVELKSTIRRVLVAAGANELLTYSFVHGNLLDKVGQDRAQAFQLSNALSPELQYYRLGLTPSLLNVVHANSKAGHDEFALFEIGRAHNTSDIGGDDLPREINSLSLVFAASDKAAPHYSGAPYYQARKFLVHLLAHFSAMGHLRFESLAESDLSQSPWLAQIAAPYEPGRCAVLYDANGVSWGVIGEYRACVRKSLKLPAFTAGFEIDPVVFLDTTTTHDYVPLSRFPKVEQDICLKVPASTTYAQVFDYVWDALGSACREDMLPSLSPVDIYQREDDSEHKQITLRLGISSYERTLTDQEVSGILDVVASAAHEHIGADRI